MPNIICLTGLFFRSWNNTCMNSCVYVAAIRGNQAFPDMPGVSLIALAFPEMSDFFISLWHIHVAGNWGNQAFPEMPGVSTTA